MSFLIDANVLVYSRIDSEYREPCREILVAVRERSVEGCVSTAILEEVWHLELRGRLPMAFGVTADLFELFSPLLAVTDEIFRRALSIDAPNRLGANDRLHAATCLELEMRAIVSADAAFDSVRGLRRVDPLDERAVARLLRSSPRT